MADDVKCIVADCDNSKKTLEAGREVWFYKFPKNEELRKTWIKQCDKDDNWNTYDSYVCSAHFREQDFEPRSVATHPLSERKLLPTAFPSIGLHVQRDLLEAINDISDSSIRSVEETDLLEAMYDICVSPVTQSTDNEQPGTSKELLKSKEPAICICKCKSYDELKHKYGKVIKLNDQFRALLLNIKKKSHSETKEISELGRNIEKMKLNEERANTDEEYFEKAMKIYFTGAQKNLAIAEKIECEWPTDAFVNTMKLKLVSERSYNFLHRYLNSPMPDSHELQQWILNLSFCKGILDEFISILSICQMYYFKPHEKKAVLQFGNMKVKSLLEYKVDTDEICGPHTQMQAVMAVSLLGTWKQPVYVSFGTKMTRKDIMKLLELLHNASITITACIFDWCHGYIRDLWGQLNVSSRDPFFYHPVTREKIYFFVDARCLLRNAREIVIREGIHLTNGDTMNIEPLKELLNNPDAAKKYPTINKKQWEICYDESEDLDLATQLFSTENANALKNTRIPDTYLKGSFIDNISKWYKLATQSNGREVCDEDSPIRYTKNIISQIIAPIGSQIDLFKEAMLISIESLLKFTHKIRQSHGDKPIMSTEKLNNNELHDLFHRICSTKEGVTPLEAIENLRSLIIGENSGIYVTHKIIDVLNLEDCRKGRASSSRNIQLSTGTTEDEELNDLITSVAEKFIDIYPDLGKKLVCIPADSPYKSCYRGENKRTAKPSETWIREARQINDVFMVHCETVTFMKTSEIIKESLAYFKNIYPTIPLKVVKYFLQERLSLRMKYLNAELCERMSLNSEEGQSESSG